MHIRSHGIALRRLYRTCLVFLFIFAFWAVSLGTISQFRYLSILPIEYFPSYEPSLRKSPQESHEPPNSAYHIPGATGPSCRPKHFIGSDQAMPCVNAEYGAALSLSTQERTLVTYAFYFVPTTNLSDPQVQNLQFFASTAVLDEPNIEYMFLMASDEPQEAKAIFYSETHPLWSQVFPTWARNFSNVHIQFPKNGQYDLCSYTMFFQTEWFRTNSVRFTRFFFINSTVRGPLIPPTVYLKVKWWDLYLDRFYESPDVALVGTMISCLFAPHLQSYTLAMDQRALKIAMDTWTCPNQTIRTDSKARIRWIRSTEVAFSAKVIRAGHTFLATASLFYRWNGKALTSKNCRQRNPTIGTGYGGWFPTPYDAIFIKTAGDVSRHRLGVHPSILLPTKTASDTCLALSQLRRQLKLAALANKEQAAH